MKLMMDAQSENPMKVRYMQRYYIDIIKTECFHEIAFYYDYDLGTVLVIYKTRRRRIQSPVDRQLDDGKNSTLGFK